MLKHNTLEMNIGGKVRSMAFDFNFLDYVTEGSDLTSVLNMQSTHPWRYVPRVAMAALQAGAERENKKEKFTIEQVTEWVMNMEDPKEMAKIGNHFLTSLGFIYQGAMGKNPLANLLGPESPVVSPES